MIFGTYILPGVIFLQYFEYTAIASIACRFAELLSNFTIGVGLQYLRLKHVSLHYTLLSDIASVLSYEIIPKVVNEKEEEIELLVFSSRTRLAIPIKKVNTITT